MIAVFDLPIWAAYLVQGVLTFVTLALAAIVCGKAGYRPYWALLLMLPFVQILALWFFAFRKEL